MGYFSSLFTNTIKKNNAFLLKLKEKQLFHELIDFMRPKISLLVMGLAIFGHLLFAPADINILYIALWAFFATTASYAYNMITDRNEDLLNHKKLNYFVIKQKVGKRLIIIFSIISIIFSLPLTQESFLFCTFSLITGYAYSKYRIKDIFPFKNIYTAGSLIIAFWVGALNTPSNLNIVIYSIPLFVLLFIASLISDLRDYTGDKKSKIRTVPVVMGYVFTKKINYYLLLFFSAYVLILGLTKLYTPLIFIIPIYIHLTRDKPKIAHKYIMQSFMILPLGVFIF